MSNRSQITYWRRRLQIRQRGRCFWCRTETALEPQEPNAITVDHLIPRSSGGRTLSWNVVGACRDCNERRRDHLTMRVLLVLVTRLVRMLWRSRCSRIKAFVLDLCKSTAMSYDFIVINTLGSIREHGCGLSGYCLDCADHYRKDVPASERVSGAFDVDLDTLILERGAEASCIAMKPIPCPQCGSLHTENRLRMPGKGARP